MVQLLECAPVSPGGLVKADCWAPPQSICISHKLLGDTDAANLETTFGELVFMRRKKKIIEHLECAKPTSFSSLNFKDGIHIPINLTAVKFTRQGLVYSQSCVTVNTVCEGGNLTPGGRQSPDGNRQRAQHARLGGSSRIPGYFYHFKKKPLSSWQSFLIFKSSQFRIDYILPMCYSLLFSKLLVNILI